MTYFLVVARAPPIYTAFMNSACCFVKVPVSVELTLFILLQTLRLFK